MRLVAHVRSAGSKLAPWVKTKGHFEYSLQRSRDHRVAADPSFRYDTFGRFFAHAWKDKMETWPIVAFTGLACCMSVAIMTWSLTKQEIWLNRAQRDPPWDWSRIRTNYWSSGSRFFVYEDKAVFRRRLPLMESLNDELLEAAIARGTRNPDGSTKQAAHH